MSGWQRSSQRATCFSRWRIELTFQVAIFTGTRAAQSTEKLVPQPQADLAFGLRTAKWLPISSSV